MLIKKMGEYKNCNNLSSLVMNWCQANDLLNLYRRIANKAAVVISESRLEN